MMIVPQEFEVFPSRGKTLSDEDRKQLYQIFNSSIDIFLESDNTDMDGGEESAAD